MLFFFLGGGGAGGGGVMCWVSGLRLCYHHDPQASIYFSPKDTESSCSLELCPPLLWHIFGVEAVVHGGLGVSDGQSGIGI